MNVTLAPAGPEWLADIAALEAACFSLPRSPEQLGRALGDFTVALSGDRFLGYADMTAVLDEGYINNVAVAPACRRQGVGERLVEALLRRGAALGLRFVTLELRAGNAAAKALYEKMGFSVVSIRRSVYEKPTEDAILMTYFAKKAESC